MKNKSKQPTVNYSKIKRNLIQRDTNGDNRFRTRAVTEERHKSEKYRPDYLDEYGDDDIGDEEFVMFPEDEEE